MHFGGMMAHAQAQVKVMVVVMLLCRLRMVVIAAGVVVVVLLCGLPLRVLFVLHASILKPDLNLHRYVNKVCR